LPHAFGAASDLTFLMLEVVSVEQQLLVLVELFPSITQRDKVGCRDLGPRELKDELLVLDEDVPDLIWHSSSFFSSRSVTLTRSSLGN
jgi:hypothetical protein